MEARAGVEEVEGRLARKRRRMIARTVQRNPAVLSRFLLYAQDDRRGGGTLSPHNLPQRVNGRAVHGPLRDTHVPQVRTSVAREAFAVLEELAAEFAADVTRWFLLLVHDCRWKDEIVKNVMIQLFIKLSQEQLTEVDGIHII